jgi:tetratricopeptide (TPR) repeat protein
VTPWVILAIPVAIVAKQVQPGHQGDYVDWAKRLLIAGDALAFYLWKLIAPIHLCFDYGRTPQVVLASRWTPLLACVPLLVGFIAAGLWRYTRAPALALLLLTAGVAPVLGLTPFDFQIYSTVGDHYLYLAMIGPAVGTGLLLSFAGQRVLAGAALLALLLGVLAHRQVWTWQTLETMSRHVLRVNPNSWASHNNIAAALMERKRFDEAEAWSKRAIEMKPEATIARRTLSGIHTMRGDVATAAGDMPAARASYEAAVQVDATNAIALSNLAATIAEAGELNRAIELYEQALRADPSLQSAQAGLEMARRRLADPAAPPR